ncbi:MAG: leucyl aminopeptidase [Candidatus Latescibacteria bacterium]|nr:leucyl aminopeptidase [Candidatus Latescibacterota bacterium]
MNISVLQGQIQKQRGSALVLNLFQGAKPGGATKAVDEALGGLIGEALASGDFTGKRNEMLLLYPGKSRKGFALSRVLVVGLGKQAEFTLEIARQTAGTAARRLQELGVESALTILHGTGAGGLEAEAAAQALAEASILACYRFDQYRSGTPERSALGRLTVVENDAARLPAIRRGLRAGSEIARATTLARDLGNHPGNVATPGYLAGVARQLARRHGMRCQVIDERGMKKLGMGALLGVAQGSAQAPRFIVLEHNKKAGGKPLVFVGKGVTFDSGGISLKPGEKMEDMKFDMSGAAAVLGAMQAVASLKVPRYIVGLVAATENLPDGRAYKPGDILKTITGKTIEIVNTDAEGRLILADALGYARRLDPAAVIDLATLTGACVVALGGHASGLFGNNEQLSERVRLAGEAVNERCWPLPLWEEHREQIKSDFADMKNSGGRPAGASTGAALLAEFAGDYPWVHLDIAGTAWSTQSRPYIPKGSVGLGVRLLVELARTWKK